MDDLELKISAADVLDSDIPDDVMLPGPTPKKKERKTDGTSNFLITCNPNISYRTVQTAEAKKAVARKLIAFGQNLGLNIRNHKLMKEMMNKPYPNVVKYEFALEQGNKQGFLHIHAIVMLDGYCQLRLPEMKKFLDRCMAPESNGGMVNVVPFKDTAATIAKYVKKHANSPYSTIKQE